MDHLEELKQNEEMFFRFMREKYPLFFNSNIFFRDIQYSINSYFKLKNNPVDYQKAEKICKNFVEYLESSQKLVFMSKNTWKVNFELDKPVSETEETLEVTEK